MTFGNDKPPDNWTYFQSRPDWPAWAFFLTTTFLLVVLSAWGIVLEKFANAMLEKVIGGKKKPAAAVAAR